jgi:L-asparaginase
MKISPTSPIKTAMLLACMSIGAAVGTAAASSVAMAQDAAPAASRTLQHIVVLATGGTIAASGTTNTQTTGYSNSIGKTGVEQLLQAVPELKRIARVDGEQIANIGSDNMTSEILLKLAKRINQLLASDDVDGVVVTHGTDTLDETSYFLNLVVRSDKPVVLAGAMRPATALGADGPMNLYEAVLVAGSKEARGRGAMVVMNDSIQSGRYVTKTNTTSLDTFKTGESGDLGVIVGNEIYIQNTLTKKHTSETPFDVSDITSLPKVDIIYAYQDDPAFVYDAVVEHGAKGIIVAGMGAGSISKPCIEAAERAMKKGVIVVRSSRTGSGFIPADPNYPGLLGDSLNPAKARILLMLALTKTQSPEEIQAYFHEY